MLLSTFALFLLPCMQAPTPALQRALISDDAVARFEAAREIATGDERTQSWILEEEEKGTAQYQRAILLAASLMGTEKTFAMVERASKRGRKADPNRAFALLLYGSFHPDAGIEASRDWDRCVTSFEQACLLSGLLSRPERLVVAPWPSLITSEKDAALIGVLDVALRLTGSKALGNHALSEAAVMLTSVNPRLDPLPAGLFEQQKQASYPDMWRLTARRTPERSLEDLQNQALVDEHIGLVLCLFEVQGKHRQALFHHDRSRAMGPTEQAWLWGAAGELGLEIPGPTKPTLELHQVAGVLGLAQQNLKKAKEIAQSYSKVAGRAFSLNASFTTRWTAGTILALSGMEADRLLLQQAFEKASGVERQRLNPIWKFANHGFEDETLRSYWLRHWIRDLGGSWIGYLDAEGRRWTAYLLLGGSTEAKNREPLSVAYPELEVLPKDYAVDHVLYRDLAEFLLSDEYRWNQ
ncbi:MAG: hypothetical protein O3A95_01735 [Planctomycetota bacterium]|nr:hypothetical protein [Planctomycetota bacterium]MDA1113004.1 hypothetical protein [Planctomycetota bacterium]